MNCKNTSGQLVRFKCLLVLVLCQLSSISLAQNWKPGDTLNTKVQDTSRIDDFGNNMIDWTGQDLIDASFPKSWPIFGSKIRMSIGGYVKVDYIQDFDGGLDRYQYPISKVPVLEEGDTRESGYMNLHARESRVNLDIRNITGKGMPLRVYLEMDFFNLSDGEFNQTPRLRHFYGVIGKFLIGRTWGTQTDIYTIPITIDFAVGDAILLTRTAQIRWESSINKFYNFAVALEMNEFPGIDANGQPGKASQILPNVVGRLTKSTDNGGRLMLGMSLFQLRWDGLGKIDNSSVFGWGLSFSGREYLSPQKHFVYWSASYGDGWGSNILTNLNGDAAAILNTDGVLESMPTWSLGFGFSYQINQTLVSNFNLSWFSVDTPDYRDIDKIKEGGSTHLNVIWSPIKNMNVGVEFMYLQRTNANHQIGTGRRLQAMAKYIF